MSRQFWMSACLGGVVAGLIWTLVPRRDDGPPRVAVESPEVKKIRVGQDGRRSVFIDLDQADSSEKKLAALERLQGMDLKGLRRELEGCPEEKYRGKLSFAVKAMILRLAELDPLIAVAFIRGHWEDDDDEYSFELNQSWKLVSAEWAHQDPLGMLTFWEETQKTQNHPFRIYPGDLADLMLAGRPLGWMTLYHITGYDSVSSSESFVSRLRSERDFREALETWNHPPEKAQQKWKLDLAEASSDWEKARVEERFTPKMNSLAQKIIRRWREVDELGFLESGFVGWEKDGE